MKELVLCSNELTIEKLNEYTQSFIDYLDVDNKTLRAYKVGIRCLFEYLKDNNITHPTRNNIIAFRDMLRQNYSSNTTNTYMVAVKSLFKYLEINKMYDNIAVDLKGAKYDTTPKKEVLSIEQIRTIYNGLNDAREKALFGLMCSTGLRVCEVSTALIEDIKEYNNEIVLFILGKKRDSKCEYVKLSKQVINDLKTYIGDRTSGNIFISTSRENYGEGISITSLRKIIKNIFKRFGIDKDTVSCHSLRRSFAVTSYETGSSIYDIQQVLHHASINTTTRYLKQVDRDKNKTEYNVANAIFG
jgi:site-specific recombinase XerD